MCCCGVSEAQPHTPQMSKLTSNTAGISLAVMPASAHAKPTSRMRLSLSGWPRSTTRPIPNAPIAPPMPHTQIANV